jgi:L-fuconolactonase
MAGTRTLIPIDAHQHYWLMSRGDYDWLTADAGPLYRDFMPADLAESLRRCAVSATVLVQAAATETETRFLLDLAQQCPSIAGVVGWVDFEADDVAERICDLVLDGRGKLKGVRPMVQDIPDPDWLDRPELDTAFEALAAHGLTFDALVTPRHLPVLENRLRRHPALMAVIDHAGKPDIAGGAFEPWATHLERIARSGTAYCKLSGLLTQAGRGAGIEDLNKYVAHIFHCFGGERVIWGSDWPVVTTSGSYEDWLELALALVDRHAPAHVEAVFASNAKRFYQLRDPAQGRSAAASRSCECR